MARKISVTKEMVKSAAFAIMREEGMDGLTARRLADKTGCSTQPIFRIYENMNELHEEAFAMAIAYYTDFYRAFMKDRPIEKPFVNFGAIHSWSAAVFGMDPWVCGKYQGAGGLRKDH